MNLQQLQDEINSISGRVNQLESGIIFMKQLIPDNLSNTMLQFQAAIETEKKLVGPLDESIFNSQIYAFTEYMGKQINHLAQKRYLEKSSHLFKDRNNHIVNQPENNFESLRKQIQALDKKEASFYSKIQKQVSDLSNRNHVPHLPSLASYNKIIFQQDKQLRELRESILRVKVGQQVTIVNASRSPRKKIVKTNKNYTQDRNYHAVMSLKNYWESQRYMLFDQLANLDSRITQNIENANKSIQHLNNLKSRKLSKIKSSLDNIESKSTLIQMEARSIDQKSTEYDTPKKAGDLQQSIFALNTELREQRLEISKRILDFERKLDQYWLPKFEL